MPSNNRRRASNGATAEIEDFPIDVPERQLDAEEVSQPFEEWVVQMESATPDALREIADEAVPEPEPVDFTPTRSVQEDRAAVAAAVTGESPARVQRLKLELNRLKEGGVFGDVDTTGTSRLMMSIPLAELGVWVDRQNTSESDNVVIRNPQVSVLPKRWVRKLSGPLASARQALIGHSYRFPVTDAFVGPSYRFIPWTEWRAFKDAYDAACKKLEEAKDELLEESNYEEAINVVLSDATKRAEQAAIQAEAVGQPVSDDFVPAFVDRVRARIPSPSAIRRGMTISFTPGVLEDDSEILDYQARVQEAQARRMEAEAKNDEVGRIKAEMREFVLESIRDRIAKSLSPFDQMVDAFKTEAYEALIGLRKALTEQGYLEGADLTRIQKLFQNLMSIREFIGVGEFSDQKLANLTDTMMGYATVSATTHSPMIGQKLEIVLADLQAECAKARRAIQEEEDTGIGAF